MLFVNFATFENYLFCKTHTHGCFWAFLKPQNKRYNDAKTGIYVVNVHFPWRKLPEKGFHLIAYLKQGCRIKLMHSNWEKETILTVPTVFLDN